MIKQLGAGIIGCGGFARGVHIPNILKNPRYRIVGAALLMSAGSEFLPKEATEIYSGGKAVYINDFMEMEYCGFDGKNSVKMTFDPQDKGHAVEIDLLAGAILNDIPAPNGPANAARAAIIGFKAVESIDTGKPVGISEIEYNF